MIKKNFNCILLNKNKIFKFQNINICDKMVLKCYLKKNDKFFKRSRFKVLWAIFNKFNNLLGKLPILSTVNIKIKNKKKKARTINYLYLQLEILDKIDSIFDLFFLKNSFFNIFYLYSKKYKLSYGQEILNISTFKNLFITNETITCDLNLNYFFSNLNIRKLKRKIFNSRKKFRFKVSFIGNNVKYVLNLISILYINNNKVLLFYYKNLKNKKIKI